MRTIKVGNYGVSMVLVMGHLLEIELERRNKVVSELIFVTKTFCGEISHIYSFFSRTILKYDIPKSDRKMRNDSMTFKPDETTF